MGDETAGRVEHEKRKLSKSDWNTAKCRSAGHILLAKKMNKLDQEMEEERQAMELQTTFQRKRFVHYKYLLQLRQDVQNKWCKLACEKKQMEQQVVEEEVQRSRGWNSQTRPA